MKFKTKLYGNIVIIIILISISVVILLDMLKQSNVNMHVVVNDLYGRIDTAAELKYQTANVDRIVKEMLHSPSSERADLSKNEWESANLRINQNIELLKDRDNQDNSIELVEKYRVLFEDYRGIVGQVAGGQNLSNESRQELLNDISLTQERMLQISSLLLGIQEQEMKNELLRSRETYNWAVTVIYIYLAITLSLGMGLVIFIIRKMTKNLNEVTTIMESIGNDNFDQLPRINISSKDEIGSISKAYNKMVSELEVHSRIEKQLLEAAEEQSWMQTEIAEIASIYPKAKNVQMLAQLLLSKLVPIVGGAFGAFYFKSDNGEESCLIKAAAYADGASHDRKDSFRMGEGLIGQCALEKKTILLNGVPNDFIKIHSSMGESSPSNIIIIPIQYKEDILAVIEIASFQPFGSSQAKLLEEITSTIGMSVNNITNHMKVEKLLQESQGLTEELQVQSEELQLQQEELRITNEKLEEQYAASEQKKKELEAVKVALEEKAQQLEISSQYKSEFLANMSHELRTPLNSLLILAQILSENKEGNFTEKQKEYIRTIHSSGKDLLLIINDILDLAKVESGKIEVSYEEMDVMGMKQQLMKQFIPIANQKGIEFDITIQPNVPESLYTDTQRLKQVLINLLSNAFKFTERGHVLLCIHKVEKDDMKSNHDEAKIAFSVIDTGIGIPGEKQQIIFDAFKQADGTISRKYGGTGLGLSISRELAGLMGGDIELDSVEGEGSTFTLCLPMTPSVERNEFPFNRMEAAAGIEVEEFLEPVENGILEQEGNEIEKRDHSLKNKKILIVDDDFRNVYALTIALETYEMDIIIAENGLEGIQMLQAHPDTDLILMDIMMPEMDGFETMRRIRQMAEYETLPIIALTAKAMKKSREECLNAGASDYISKPIDIDQLFSLMNVWLYKKEGAVIG